MRELFEKNASLSADRSEMQRRRSSSDWLAGLRGRAVWTAQGGGCHKRRRNFADYSGGLSLPAAVPTAAAASRSAGLGLRSPETPSQRSKGADALCLCTEGRKKGRKEEGGWLWGLLRRGWGLQDISFVVDCGRRKLLTYDPSKKINRLAEEAVSKANAQQRAGRAGRVAAGECFRLYTRKEFQVLDEWGRLRLQAARQTVGVSFCLKTRLSSLPLLQGLCSRASLPSP